MRDLLGTGREDADYLVEDECLDRVHDFVHIVKGVVG